MSAIKEEVVIPKKTVIKNLIKSVVSEPKTPQPIKPYFAMRLSMTITIKITLPTTFSKAFPVFADKKVFQESRRFIFCD